MIARSNGNPIVHDQTQIHRPNRLLYVDQYSLPCLLLPIIRRLFVASLSSIVSDASSQLESCVPLVLLQLPHIELRQHPNINHTAPLKWSPYWQGQVQRRDPEIGGARERRRKKTRLGSAEAQGMKLPRCLSLRPLSLLQFVRHDVVVTVSDLPWPWHRCWIAVHQSQPRYSNGDLRPVSYYHHRH